METKKQYLSPSFIADIASIQTAITEEHKSFDYLNKLSGKQITTNNYTSKIISVDATGKLNQSEDFPDWVRYKTKAGEIILPFFVAIQLIESGFGIDAIGFIYKVQ